MTNDARDDRSLPAKQILRSNEEIAFDRGRENYSCGLRSFVAGSRHQSFYGWWRKKKKKENVILFIKSILVEHV